MAACAGSAVSFAMATKLNGPDCVGVPDRTPAEESVTPEGSAPDATVHAYGAKPPIAPRLAVYGWLTTEPAIEDFEMPSGSHSRIASVACDVVRLSTPTLPVEAKVPSAVGAAEMVPAAR